MSDENKAVVRRLLEEVWAGGNLETAEELIDDGYRTHLSEAFSIRMSRWTGPSIVHVEVATYRSAFPDLAVEVHSAVGDGDEVGVFWTVRGTNSGTMRLSPSEGVVAEEAEPCGKELSTSASSHFRLTEGKIVEATYLWDPLALLDQVRLFAKGVHTLQLGQHRVSVVAPPE